MSASLLLMAAALSEISTVLLAILMELLATSASRQVADFILNLHTNEPYHNKAYLETLLNYSTEYKEKSFKDKWLD